MFSGKAVDVLDFLLAGRLAAGARLATGLRAPFAFPLRLATMAGPTACTSRG